MFHKYIVALGVRPNGRDTWPGGRRPAPAPAAKNAPQAQRVPVAVRVLSHYVLSDPVLAGEFLTAAVARAEYVEALAHIQGSGLGSRAEQVHDGLHGRVAGADLWALVVYDGRDYGTRDLPFVGFGDARHKPARLLPPAAVGADLLTEATAHVPGLMGHGAARLHAGALFVNLTTVAATQL